MTFLAQIFRVVAICLIGLGLSGAAIAQQTSQPHRPTATGGRQLAGPDISTLRAVFGSGTGSDSGRRGARMERAIGRLAPSADDGRRHPRRRRRFRQLHRRHGAAGRAARHQPRGVRATDGRAHARPEHHGSARRPAGVQQIALGLSRSPGERRAHRARARAVGAIRLGVLGDGARLRRRSAHHRRHLGRGIELRHQGRRPLGAALDRDARLRRPPPRLLPRGISLGAGNPRARRRQARPADRLLGRRLRPDPVHADHVQALRGGLRP